MPTLRASAACRSPLDSRVWRMRLPVRPELDMAEPHVFPQITRHLVSYFTISANLLCKSLQNNCFILAGY